MSFDSYKWIKSYKRAKAVTRINETDTNITSADDTQAWPSGPFGKKDDYADESPESYERDKDWQPDKPGEDEATKDTGYKTVNEDYRDPKENTAILQALLSDPKHSKYVTKELIQYLEDENELDSFVENMLDELNPNLGRYKLPNIRPE